MFTAENALGSSIVVLCALLTCTALRRRSAAVRHLLLAAGIFAAASVAPLSLVLPAWNVSLSRAAPAPAAAPAAGGDASEGTVSPQALAGASPGGDLVRVALVLGCGIGLAMLVISILRIARMTRMAARVQDERWLRHCDRLSGAYGLKRPAVLLRTRTLHIIGTWGIRRPCVLLPSDAEGWDEPRIHVVLAHELAHVCRRDWLIQTVADVIRAVFWFNPLFWVACRRLRRESEQACDDAVLAAGVPPAHYAAQLVAIARTCRQTRATWGSAVPIVQSSLEGRIAAMLNTAHDRRPPTRRTRAVAIAGLLTVAVVASTPGSSAQTAPLPLTGHVYDPSGAVIPQVALTLREASVELRLRKGEVLEGDGSVIAQATTDSSGRFEFPPVGPGRYVLTASLARFRPLRHELALNRARDWDRAVTLQLGTLQEAIVVSDRRPPAVTPESGVALRTPLRMGGNIRPPLKTLDVKPVYPASMRDAGLEGVVPIDAVIGTEGTVTSVRVVSAQVHPDFAIAAVDAVRQWRFTPTLLNGDAVEVVMTVSVEFKLSEK
jgi:TonB family protein